jgi:outer membrane receptor for monomeric catechols
MQSTTSHLKFLRPLSALLITALTLFVTAALAADIKVTLTGAEEVPAVTTSATASGTIKIADDKSVSGSIKTSDIEGTMAHIHLAPAGKNGPPIITLTKNADNEWLIPAGAMLTDEQFAMFKAGSLYVNVHSASKPAGEIRGQLKP